MLPSQTLRVSIVKCCRFLFSCFSLGCLCFTCQSKFSNFWINKQIHEYVYLLHVYRHTKLDMCVDRRNYGTVDQGKCFQKYDNCMANRNEKSYKLEERKKSKFSYAGFRCHLPISKIYNIKSNDSSIDGIRIRALIEPWIENCFIYIYLFFISFPPTFGHGTDQGLI